MPWAVLLARLSSYQVKLNKLRYRNAVLCVRMCLSARPRERWILYILSWCVAFCVSMSDWLYQGGWIKAWLCVCVCAFVCVSLLNCSPLPIERVPSPMETNTNQALACIMEQLLWHLKQARKLWKRKDALGSKSYSWQFFLWKMLMDDAKNKSKWQKGRAAGEMERVFAAEVLMKLTIASLHAHVFCFLSE